MFGRFTWYVLVLLLGVMTIGFQMDRQAATRFGLAQSVPAAFRFDALVPLVIQKLDDGQNEEALSQAVQLVRRSPINAEGLSIYAVAANSSGDQRAAAQALSLAAGRGWRAKPAQLAMISFALSAGEGDVAAARLGALWAVGDIDAQVAEATRISLARADVRRAFIRQNLGNPGRTGAVIAWAGANLDPMVFAEFLAEIREEGGRFDCDTMGRAIVRLLEDGRGAAAAKAWSLASCGRSMDYRFAPEGVKGPFSWVYPGAAALDRRVEPSGRISYSNDDLVDTELVWRYAVLGAGEHAASVGAEGVIPSLVVSCMSEGRAKRLFKVQFVGGQAGFDIPADCGAQRLAVSVPRGKGAVSRFSIR